MKTPGFTLIEVLISLTIAAAMVIAISTGLTYTLKRESTAVQKSTAALLMKSIECAHINTHARETMLQRHDNKWLFLEYETEDHGATWKTWQITPSDRQSAIRDIFFIE